MDDKHMESQVRLTSEPMLREQCVDCADLYPCAPAPVSQVGCSNVIATIGNQQW